MEIFIEYLRYGVWVGVALAVVSALRDGIKLQQLSQQQSQPLLQQSSRKENNDGH